MSPRALKVCSTPNCPELVDPGVSRCPTCSSTAEHARGTRQQRGYGREHDTRFRRNVLLRDPLCVCEEQAHGHSTPCLAQSTVADHWPLSKRDLRAQGADEHDPARGRGLCKSCHDKHTSRAQPGGWHGSDRG